MPYMDKYELAWRHKQGASIGVLAQLNGCKPKAILTEMEKAGEAQLKLEDKVELDHFRSVGKERAELLLDGCSVAEIAEIQGVSKSAVYGWIYANISKNERQKFLRGDINDNHKTKNDQIIA